VVVTPDEPVQPNVAIVAIVARAKDDWECPAGADVPVIGLWVLDTFSSVA